MYIVFATNTALKHSEFKLVDVKTLQQVASLLEASPEYTTYSIYHNGKKLGHNDLPQLSPMCVKLNTTGT